MIGSFRPWWQNCALESDDEMIAIDRMEDRIAPLDANAVKIRELISTLELCHHKADRWVHNIIEAIGVGETQKGLGTRPPGQQHSAETVWQNACAALSAWCAGHPSTKVDVSIGDVPASQLLACLGERSPLKEWQVQRVIEKIRSAIRWPQSDDDPTAQYVWLLLGGSDYEVMYRDDCPEYYKEHEDFWQTTVRTMIHDTESGDDAELSLGIAIDMLMPCNWGFVANLQLVLGAIGGNLDPEQPFAACGRNITLVPIRHRMGVVSNTLNTFWSEAESNQDVDRDLLAMLGDPTPVSKWLAASLDKTIRLQLSPPAELRCMSALAGPDWIRQ